MFEFARAGEEDDAESENERRQRRGEIEENSQEASSLMGLMIAGKWNCLSLMPPLKDQKPEGQEEKQENEWMGKKHG